MHERVIEVERADPHARNRTIAVLAWGWMLKRRTKFISAFVACALFSLSIPADVSAIDEAERLWLVGERAFADRLFPVARRTLERFLAQYPTDARAPRALLMLGKTRLALNDAQAALEALERAQALPTPPGEAMEVRFWQGEALFRLKRWDDARAAYDDVLKHNAASPLAADALYGLGWSELEARHLEPAVTAFRDFIAAWPDHALAPSAMLTLARTLVDLKRFNDALPVLATLQSKYPAAARQAADAQYLLGWVKIAAGDPRGGVADLRAFVTAHANHPQAPEARRLITQTLGKFGDRDELGESYKTLMEQQPATAEALYEAAGIAGRLGRAREPVWKRIRAEFPEHPLTRRLALDLANTAFKQKNYADAAAYAAVAAQSGDDAVKSEAWLLAGESQLKLKKFPAAAKAFESVGGVTGAEAGVRFRALAGLGLAREELKEWRAALTAYEAVANRSPDVTLRDWARQRAAEVRSRLSSTPATPSPVKKKDS